MVLQEQDNLSARISRVTNQLAASLETLEQGIFGIDTALFGSRPTPATEDRVGSPSSDSVESNVGRLERLQGRCLELLKFTGDVRQRVDGSAETRKSIESPMIASAGRW